MHSGGNQVPGYSSLLTTIATLVLAAASVSCADTGDNVRPRPQITSCPEGLILICESGRPQQASKGGPEEEIPQYDRCRCEIQPM